MSIATERNRLAAIGLVMRRREQWGARFNYTSSRPVEVADQLAGHIAVVRDPGDLLGTEDQVMRNIESIGISRFPATGYSYNAAAFNSGRLYEGQPLERRGAHTVNDRRRSTCSQSGCPSRGDSLAAPSWNNNVNTRAIVAPQMPGDRCTDAQVDAFARWGAGLKLAGFAKASARWHGHRCYAAKDCPSAQVWARLDEVQDLTADYVRAGNVGAAPEEDFMGFVDNQTEFNTAMSAWWNKVMHHRGGAQEDIPMELVNLRIAPWHQLLGGGPQNMHGVMAELRSAITGTLPALIREAGDEVGLTPAQIEAMSSAIAAKVERVTVVVEEGTDS